VPEKERERERERERNISTMRFKLDYRTIFSQLSGLF
jgi:hypothetical protein